MRVTWCCLLLILGFAVTFAQAPDTLWTKTYGGAENDVGYSIQQTSDNGYIIAGYTESFGAGGQDVWLLKTDGNGDTVWTKTYGGPDDDGAKSVQQTMDGGYIMTGYKGSSGADSADVWLLKTDENGDTIWTKTYGGDSVDRGHSVQQTNDGGYVIAGYTCSFGSGWDDVYLIKTNSLGDTTWTKTYGYGGGAWRDHGNSVQQTVDGGYIVAGWNDAGGTASVWLVKTNSSGDSLWTKTYGGSDWDCGNSVQQTTDGGYIIAGYTYSFGAGFTDVYLIKTDSLSDTLWTKTYGGMIEDLGESVQQTTDGGYIITGSAGLLDPIRHVVYSIKTDSSGDTIWTKTYGGDGDDNGYSMQQTTDGGYIVVGYSQSFGAGGSDLWIIKTEPDVGINENKPFVVTEKGITSTILRGPLQLPTDRSCRVFDITGRQINIVDPAPGIYFIEVDGRLTQKVVKVR